MTYPRDPEARTALVRYVKATDIQPGDKIARDWPELDLVIRVREFPYRMQVTGRKIIYTFYLDEDVPIDDVDRIMDECID